VGRVELEPLLDGFVPGQPTSGKQTRSTAITPDGRFAFASHGNEGKITVIDTSTMEIVSQVTVPSPLRGGGYLLAFQPGTAPWDPAFR
jgi:DNA-binding beta-propeller fold protein YncE